MIEAAPEPWPPQLRRERGFSRWSMLSYIAPIRQQPGPDTVTSRISTLCHLKRTDISSRYIYAPLPPKKYAQKTS
jgi:hypothetical protein